MRALRDNFICSYPLLWRFCFIKPLNMMDLYIFYSNTSCFILSTLQKAQYDGCVYLLFKHQLFYTVYPSENLVRYRYVYILFKHQLFYTVDPSESLVVAQREQKVREGRWLCPCWYPWFCVSSLSILSISGTLKHDIDIICCFAKVTDGNLSQFRLWVSSLQPSITNSFPSCINSFSAQSG